MRTHRNTNTEIPEQEESKTKWQTDQRLDGKRR